MTRSRGGAPTPEQADRLARYVSGELSGEERAALEREILADDALADALYGELALRSLPLQAPGAPARAIPATRPRSRPPFWRWQVALPAAAAVIAVFSMLWIVGRQTAGPGRTLRGQGGAPRLLEPLGEVERVPGRFAWTPAAGAASYRLEVLDAEGRVRYETVTPRTSHPLPAGALPDTLALLRWRVVPVDAASRELPASEFATLRIPRR